MPAPTPELNNTSVRKWGTQKLCLADPTTPSPTELFGPDHLPIAMPAGYVDLGYITTDGVSTQDSISSENTNMLQSLDPVRVDLTGRERTLTVTFGERNAHVKALEAGLPVSQWPLDKYGPTDFTQGTDAIEDFPYYRLLLFKQDGVGAGAVFGVECLYRVKPKSRTDRTRSRTAVDSAGFTFGLFRDPTANATLREAEDGPGIGTASTLPTIAAITPTGAAPGDLVRIYGSHIGTATEVLFGADEAEFEPIDASSLMAIVPAATTGPVSVVVSTGAGDSLPFAYTAA